jgi:hypothetical protein
MSKNYWYGKLKNAAEVDLNIIPCERKKEGKRERRRRKRSRVRSVLKNCGISAIDSGKERKSVDVVKDYERRFLPRERIHKNLIFPSFPTYTVHVQYTVVEQYTTFFFLSRFRLPPMYVISS